MDSTVETHRSMRFNTLLGKLKSSVSYEELVTALTKDENLNSSAKQRAAIISLDEQLEELRRLVETLEKNNIFDSIEILEWMKLFEPDSTLQTLRKSRFEEVKKAGKKGYEYLMVGLNLVSIALGITAICHGHSQFASQVILPFSKGKSYSAKKFGVIGGLTEGIKQIRHGDYLVGSGNILAASTIIATGLTTLIGSLILHTIPAATSVALGAVSMVFVQALGAAIELYQARRKEKRIEELKHLVNEEPDTTKRMQLQKLLLLEMASLKDHKQKAKNYATSALVLLSVSVVAYLCLSGISFGVVPAASIAIALCGAVLGLIQHFFFKPKAKEELEKTSVVEIEDNTTGDKAKVIYVWQKLLNEAIRSGDKHEITLSNGKTIPILKQVELKNGLFHQRELSFKDYVDDLLVSFPKKGLAIVQALNTKDEAQLMKALAIKQHAVSVEPTLGKQLLDKLLDTEEEPVNEEDAEVALHVEVV